MKKLILTLTTILTLLSNPASASDDGTQEPAESITLINVFVVPAGKAVETIKFWENAAEFMKKQPGYISTALHRAILPDAKFQLINIAKWESVEAYKNAGKARQTQSTAKLIEGLIPNPAIYSIIRTD